jgi:hypothetical protein
MVALVIQKTSLFNNGGSGSSSYFIFNNDVILKAA